jgi:cob(I)alamin adenosyltransferase
MLYTRAGDTGTTKVLNSKPGARVSKSSCQTEALGALDELNSFLGLLKVKLTDVKWMVPGTIPARMPGRAETAKDRKTRVAGAADADLATSTEKPADIIHWVQNCLFIVQAEAAGSDKHVDAAHTEAMEYMIDHIEQEMPPIKTFFISGGTELAALSDVCRTLSRKAERRVIASQEQGSVTMNSSTLQFLNRLSSLLYALSRYVNWKQHATEQAPWYD